MPQENYMPIASALRQPITSYSGEIWNRAVPSDSLPFLTAVFLPLARILFFCEFTGYILHALRELLSYTFSKFQQNLNYSCLF